MSTINKKPFIKSLIEDLKENDGYLETLQLLIDGGGIQTPILRTLSIKPSGNRTNITAADAGVCLCNLEANYSLYNGYLCFTDNYCVLIAFTDSQKLTMFAITEGGHNFETIDEELSVLELRSELMDISGGGSSSAFQPFSDEWPISGSTKNLCDAINADPTALVGMAYLGEVVLSDMPGDGLLSNAEVEVEILDGISPTNKTIHLTMTSGNIAPYRWEYTYWGNGANLSGWVPMGDINSAPVYSPASTYAIGDLVLYGNRLYKCSTAIVSPEAWNAAHWTVTTVADAVLGLINTGI